MKFSKTAIMLSMVVVTQSYAAEYSAEDVVKATQKMNQIEKDADDLLSKDPDAFNVKGTDCAKLYQAKVIKKMKRKRKFRDTMDKVTEVTAFGSFPVFLVGGLTGNLPLMAGAFIVGTSSIFGHWYLEDHTLKSPKFAETLKLMNDDASNAFKAFSADVQSRVKKKSITVTEEDVVNAVKFGFESGGFCRGERQNPMNRNKMVKFTAEHILSQHKNK